MKCLVTGGSGFIGGHLVSKLLEQGHETTVLDHRKPAHDVEWLQADIRREDTLRLRGFEAVYHLAALSNARRCGQSPQACYELNVLGTLNLARAALRDGVRRMLLASTAWVAAAQEGHTVDEASLFDVPRINTIYAASKLSQELLLYSHFAEAGGPCFTILRYGTPYGEGMWKGLVIREFMETAESKGVISVLGDGKQYREFLYVGDLCDAQVLALDEIATNRVYNLTGDSPVTVEQLAREVIKHFPAEIRHLPQTRAEPEPRRIRNDRAKSELGWMPSTTLAEGVARCAAWWRSIPEDQKRAQYWG